MTDEYMAGFFDGEGCIGLYGSKTSSSCCLRVTITQVRTEATEALLNLWSKEFGGSVGVHPMTEQRDKLIWQISSERAVTMIKRLAPKLVLKREQAEAAIEWWNGRTMPGRDTAGRMQSKSAEEKERDAHYIKVLKDLKKAA